MNNEILIKSLIDSLKHRNIYSHLSHRRVFIECAGLPGAHLPVWRDAKDAQQNKAFLGDACISEIERKTCRQDSLERGARWTYSVDEGSDFKVL